jgi:drug/metabolite transporter (DMT)-like permease
LKSIDYIELVVLAALWGGSFLFMRLGAPEFGPVALIALRTGIAMLTLLPAIVLMRKLGHIRGNALALLALGIISTALPFTLLSWAVLYVSAGYASIINSTATIFTALIAWLWVNERLSLGGVSGILLGTLGVVVLALDRIEPGKIDLLPLFAGLVATLCYGIGTNYSKQKLAHVAPLVIAFGSQTGATLVLLPFALWLWPAQAPSADAWLAVAGLGVFCTGIAFILFFRLIARVGVNRAISVTYLIPFFGVIWGMLFLDEVVTLYMLVGGGLILLGVGLTTGLIGTRR